MKHILNIFLFVVCTTSIAHSQSDTIKAIYKGESYKIRLEITYPGYAIEHEISGVVEYRFHIDNNGCLDSILIINSPHESLSNEVKRAIFSLKCDWSPYNSWINDKFNFVYQ